jgi:hypothetical protein
MDAGIVGPGNIGAKAAPCLEFSAYLSRLWRADERTRSADPCSLRMRGQTFLGIAGVCKSHIEKRLCVLCIAHYCRVLRAG